MSIMLSVPGAMRAALPALGAGSVKQQEHQAEHDDDKQLADAHQVRALEPEDGLRRDRR
jgi:hypothetical protein